MHRMTALDLGRTCLKPWDKGTWSYKAAPQVLRYLHTTLDYWNSKYSPVRYCTNPHDSVRHLAPKVHVFCSAILDCARVDNRHVRHVP